MTKTALGPRFAVEVSTENIHVYTMFENLPDTWPTTSPLTLIATGTIPVMLVESFSSSVFSLSLFPTEGDQSSIPMLNIATRIERDQHASTHK